MTVECITNEFNDLTLGGRYTIQEIGVNSFMVGGVWYGRSNFTLIG